MAWWKAHAEKFLILSTMTHDFLAIRLTTVYSESAFSLGGRILGKSKSSLTLEMLEAFVCRKDWLFKEKDVYNGIRVVCITFLFHCYMMFFK